MSNIEREDMEMLLDMALNKAGEALEKAEDVLKRAGDGSSGAGNTEDENVRAESAGAQGETEAESRSTPVVITVPKNTAQGETEAGAGATPVIITVGQAADQGAGKNEKLIDNRTRKNGKIEAESNVQVTIEKISDTTRILYGVILVILAVYLVLHNLKIIPAVPVIPAFVTFLCLYALWKGVKRRSFSLTIMPLAVIFCVFDRQFGITSVKPWVFLGAAALLSSGLSLLFSKDKPKHVTVELEGLQARRPGKASDPDDTDREETIESDPEKKNEILIENNFNSVTQYVESESFSKVFIENNMGSCNVYFSNKAPAVEDAAISVENNMGNTRLYLPADWHLIISNQNAMGSLKLHGDYNHDEAAPNVRLHVENNMGRVDVHFE